MNSDKIIYKILLLFIALFSAVNTYSQSVKQSDLYGLSNTGSDKNSIKLSFNSEEPEIRKIKVGNEDYYSVNIRGFQHSTITGKPEIPVSTSLIDVSGKKINKIIISNIRSKRIYPGRMGFSGQMYPRQENLTKNQDPQDRAFRKDYSAYSSDKPIVSDTVLVKYLGKMRGQSLALITVNPLIYYPASNYFDLIVSMDIKILSTSIAKSSIPTTSTVYSSKGIVNKGLVYYNEEDVTPSFSLTPSSLIIVSDTSMKQHLAPLIKWKNLKGFRIKEIYVGENGITRSYSSIKDTLTKIWNSATLDDPAPEFMIIAGDLNIIPKSDGAGGISDLYYSEFDGDGDFLPDMFSGRLPAKDTSEMKAMVEKILQYERFEFADTIDHYKKALLFQGVDGGHIEDMDGQLSYANNYYINESNGVEPYVFLYEPNSIVRDAEHDSVALLLDRGVGFVNYTGHGTPTKWMDIGGVSGYSYEKVNDLTNSNRYPVIISNACETAAFNYENNLGAAFVKGEKKGALAFIGCINSSYWEEDFWWSVGLSNITANPKYETSGPGIYDRLFHSNGEEPSEWFTTLGQIIYAGNLSVLSSPSSLKKYYWQYYTLLGDPSIVPYIGNPGDINISLPDSIPATLKTLSFTSLPFSYAAISDFDTLWDASSVTPSGAVALNIPEGVKDSCLIIVSAQNMKPYFKTIYFNNPDTAYLSINDVNPNDENENNNGLAEFSEIISFDIQIQNSGNQSADDAYILLSSDSEYLTILQNSIALNSINPLSESTINACFSVQIADNIPDKEIISPSLRLVYGNDTLVRDFDFSIHSPEPTIVSWDIDDSILGNGNIRPEAGEQFNINVAVSNNGSVPCNGTLSLRNLTTYLSVDANDLESGLINPGDTIIVSFIASLGHDCPEAYTNNIQIEFNYSPYISTRDIIIVGGSYTEDFEHGKFNHFPWINNSVLPWYINTESSFRNSLAASSGNASTGGNTSSLEIILNIPTKDTIRFMYKVSSELDWDFMKFKVGDSLKIKESGEVDWTQAEIELPAGVHTLSWQYIKDGSENHGYDMAWIDFIQFPTYSFLNNDLAVSQITTPSEPNKNYANETVAAKVINLGRDTALTVSLSYRINEGTITNQVFNKEIIPGDSATLEFSTLADLDEPGDYKLEVFIDSNDDFPGNDTISMELISTGIKDIVINSSDFKIGPNPYNDYTNILVQEYFQNLQLTLINSSGNTVWEKNYRIVNKGMRISISGNNYAQGIYYLRIKTDSNNYLYKLIKQ